MRPEIPAGTRVYPRKGMTPEQLQSYHEHRRKGYNPASARAAATAKPAPDIDWQEDRNKGEQQATILRPPFILDVKIVDDDSPDTSYMGTMSDTWEPGCLPWAKVYDDGSWDRREYRWFHPCNGEDEARAWYTAHGYGRHEAWLRAHRQVVEDRDLLRSLHAGDWSFVGIVAVAHLSGVEVGHASCWGFEFRDWRQDREYINDAALDIANEAEAVAKQWVGENAQLVQQVALPC